MKRLENDLVACMCTLILSMNKKKYANISIALLKLIILVSCSSVKTLPVTESGKTCEFVINNEIFDDCVEQLRNVLHSDSKNSVYVSDVSNKGDYTYPLHKLSSDIQQPQSVVKIEGKYYLIDIIPDSGDVEKRGIFSYDAVTEELEIFILPRMRICHWDRCVRRGMFCIRWSQIMIIV